MIHKTAALQMEEIVELIIKNWMTHDIMWFYNYLKEFGVGKNNKINKTAIRDMSTIKIKRIQKGEGVECINSFDEFKRFFDLAMSIATGTFMKYVNSSPAHNIIQSERKSCLAYDGVKAMGVEEHYECGIMLRINAWLETMGIPYEIAPEITGCMMHTDGKCYQHHRFSSLRKQCVANESKGPQRSTLLGG